MRFVRNPDESVIPEDSFYRPRSKALASMWVLSLFGLVAIIVGIYVLAGALLISAFVLGFGWHQPLETKGFDESEEWLWQNWESMDAGSRASAIKELKKRFGSSYGRIRKLEVRLTGKS